MTRHSEGPGRPELAQRPLLNLCVSICVCVPICVCLCICLCLCVSMCVSVYGCMYLRVSIAYLSVCLRVACMYLCVSMCVYLCMSIAYLPVCLCVVCVYLCTSVCISVSGVCVSTAYVPVCVSVWCVYICAWSRVDPVGPGPGNAGREALTGARCLAGAVPAAHGRAPVRAPGDRAHVPRQQRVLPVQ